MPTGDGRPAPGYGTGMTLLNGLVPSILMLAAIALLIGGVTMLRRGDRTRGLLMLVAAAVFVGNVLILQIPVAR